MSRVPSSQSWRRNSRQTFFPSFLSLVIRTRKGISCFTGQGTLVSVRWSWRSDPTPHPVLLSYISLPHRDDLRTPCKGDHPEPVCVSHCREIQKYQFHQTPWYFTFSTGVGLIQLSPPSSGPYRPPEPVPEPSRLVVTTEVSPTSTQVGPTISR